MEKSIIVKRFWRMRNMIELVKVEAGSFIMGSDSTEKEESPSHEVELSSFYIGKYLITQEQWFEYMNKTCSYNRGNKNPVEMVSWIDSIIFCNILSKAEGLSLCYFKREKDIYYDIHANGYRLPSEAEWEFAAKGGIGSKGYLYSGSNNPFDIGWFKDNSDKCTHEVGLLEANELGIYDMSGNVYEYCWDVFKLYTKEKKKNPNISEYCKESDRHVLRGGNCHGFSNRLRCTSRRNGLYKGFIQDFVGFRIAKNA